MLDGCADCTRTGLDSAAIPTRMSAVRTPIATSSEVLGCLLSFCSLKYLPQYSQKTVARNTRAVCPPVATENQTRTFPHTRASAERAAKQIFTSAANCSGGRGARCQASTCETEGW